MSEKNFILVSRHLRALYHVRIISYDFHSHCTPHARCSTWGDPKTALAPLNPLPAGSEGRQSVALALWGFSDLISNQTDMILAQRDVRGSVS